MKLRFKVQNLKCGGCANSITKKLESINKIQHVHVDAETAIVEVEAENEEMQAVIKESLLHLGYPVEGDKNAFSSKAKSFISCATGRMSN